MTQKRIVYALNRIEECKKNGYPLEALLKTYQLNISLITWIISYSDRAYSTKNKKLKLIIEEFLEKIEQDPKLKSIIPKRNVKILKPWLVKMDRFFKQLKAGENKNTKALQEETEKILNVLNISANKLFALTKK